MQEGLISRKIPAGQSYTYRIRSTLLGLIRKRRKALPVHKPKGPPVVPELDTLPATRIRVLSDLHLEHADWTPPAVPCDLIVLAGDIGSGTQGITWARKAFPDTPIVYVAGNHEFYGFEIDAMTRELRAAATAESIHFLERDIFCFRGLRILGATLWTDFKLFGLAEQWFAERAALAGMADCRLIRAGLGMLTPPRMAERQEDAVRWLESELPREWPGKTVVVSHHLPSMQCVSAHHRASLLTAAFASNLDALFEGADLWIHGHTHTAADFQAGRCRVVCNPRGYPGERTSKFDDLLTIEL